MATFNSTNYQADQTVEACSVPGVPKIAYFTCVTTAAIANSDIIKLVRMPGSHRPSRIFYDISDPESSGTAVLHTGTTADADQFGSTTTSNAGVVSLPAALTTFMNDVPATAYDLQITVASGVTTGNALTVRGFVEYYLPYTVKDPTPTSFTL